MTTYIVKYRLKGRLFPRWIRKVKGDGLVEGGRHRFFILSDESRHEIPVDGTSFWFSAGRFLVIQQNMESQAGQALPLRR